MKAFLIVSMILLVSGIAYSQDVKTTENDQLKIAMIEMAKLIADQKIQKDDQSKTEHDKLVQLQDQLSKSTQDIKDANQRALVIGATVLPVGVFIGCASAGKWELGTIMASSTLAGEGVIWGILELYKISRSLPDPKNP